MARYRRNKKNDFSQDIFKLVIIIAVALSFSPFLRELIFSYLKIALPVMFFVGVIFLVYKMKSPKAIEVPGLEPISSSPYLGSSTNIPATKLEKEWETSSAGGCSASSEWALGGVTRIAPLAWNIELLRSLEWKRFETVCSEYLKIIGHDAKETRIGPDGGVDIIVHKEGQEKPLAIVQCKAWSKKHKVGVKPIRELFGIMAAEQVVNGMFITTGDYTSDASQFAKGKNLKLITGERLLAVIRQLPAERKARLLALATEGDYTTPTCPRCGIKLTLRSSVKGRYPGRKFWGCLNYPTCNSRIYN